MVSLIVVNIVSLHSPEKKNYMALPYADENASKKMQVASMFNSIAHRYDFLNHFLSAGIDNVWRRRAIRILALKRPKSILDIATGTGDFAISALKANPDFINGIDISEGMLKIGQEKIKKKGLTNKIKLETGDSENINFTDNKFDAITCAFGVRNFENLENGLKEMFRVLKTGGTCIILEFSKPTTFPIKQMYSFYFKNVLPTVGRLFSKDSRAYSYLPESVSEFPHGQEFLNIMVKTGFCNTKCKTLTFGIASIYIGEK